MAATGPPPEAPVPPTNYYNHYAQLQDVLNGDYAAVYAIYHPTTGQPSNTIFDTVVDSTGTILKVFLALISTPDGTYNAIPVHNPSCFKPSMVAAATQWDGKVFAFLDYLSPASRYISTVSLPDNVFHTVTEQSVHPTNYITAAFSAAQPTLQLLNPITNGTPGTDLITTRAVVPVPHRYIQTALSRLPLQPCAAWNLFANAVVADNLDISCAIFLDWLRVAITKRYDLDGTIIMAPTNHLGLRNTAFPPVIDDQPFADRRRSIITRNLPALDQHNNTTTAITTTHYYQLLGVLRSERAADQAPINARRIFDKQDKCPSKTKWRYAATRWMQLTGCPT